MMPAIASLKYLYRSLPDFLKLVHIMKSSARVNDVSDNRCRYEHARPFHAGKHLYPGREGRGQQVP
jgi:hypothetical protein